MQQFYEAFQKGDAEKMIDCYHPEVVFEDPAFGQLNATEAANMWRMLIERGREILTLYFRTCRQTKKRLGALGSEIPIFQNWPKSAQ
ncbi:MAG: nuclear transport factor 2 family protein [Saprospiraceae bacterium]